jgi:hypothetical protein
MKPAPIFHWIILPLLAMGLAACGLSRQPSATAAPASTLVPSTQTVDATLSAPAAAETPTVEVLQQATASISGSSCTVLQDLNLRSGPGTAYRPPLQILHKDSILTPLGFAPNGIPGGSWAYVQDQATQNKGWVSAGTQYITCDVEITSLSAVAFDQPPPFLPKTVQTSPGPGEGFCKDSTNSEYSCVLTFSDDYLFQVQVFKNGVELNENDGVEPISFTVTKDDNVVYSNVENNAAYCIFGGNGPCNQWVFEGGVLKWKAGGTPVESGEYKVAIDVTVNGESSHWESFFTLAVP